MTRAVRLIVAIILSLVFMLLLASMSLADDRTDLSLAIRQGNLAAVRRIVEKNPALVTSADDAGFTPLHIAATAGRVDIVDYLLGRGADIEARTAGGQTPLFQTVPLVSQQTFVHSPIGRAVGKFRIPPGVFPGAKGSQPLVHARVRQQVPEVFEYIPLFATQFHCRDRRAMSNIYPNLASRLPSSIHTTTFVRADLSVREIGALVILSGLYSAQASYLPGLTDRCYRSPQLNVMPPVASSIFRVLLNTFATVQPRTSKRRPSGPMSLSSLRPPP